MIRSTMSLLVMLCYMKAAVAGIDHSIKPSMKLRNCLAMKSDDASVKIDLTGWFAGRV